jgi:hypothetical protein
MLKHIRGDDGVERRVRKWQPGRIGYEGDYIARSRLAESHIDAYDRLAAPGGQSPVAAAYLKYMALYSGTSKHAIYRVIPEKCVVKGLHIMMSQGQPLTDSS